MNTGRCRSCGREVVWAKTQAGKHMPVDPEPYAGDDTAANLAIYRGVDGNLRARVLTKADPDLRSFEWRGMPHFATCVALLAQRGKVPGVRSLQLQRTKRGRT